MKAYPTIDPDGFRTAAEPDDPWSVRKNPVLRRVLAGLSSLIMVLGIGLLNAAPAAADTYVSNSCASHKTLLSKTAAGGNMYTFPCGYGTPLKADRSYMLNGSDNGSSWECRYYVNGVRVRYDGWYYHDNTPDQVIIDCTAAPPGGGPIYT